jgi:hypothetical protein
MTLPFIPLSPAGRGPLYHSAAFLLAMQDRLKPEQRTRVLVIRPVSSSQGLPSGKLGARLWRPRYTHDLCRFMLSYVHVPGLYVSHLILCR